MSEEFDIVDKLILEGGLEISGVDIETGEFLYNFTEKLKDLNPGLHENLKNFFYAEVINLWEKGFVNISFFDENPMVTLSDKALDKDKIKSLTYEQQKSLEQIKRLADES
jgi:hypothetical protein